MKIVLLAVKSEFTNIIYNKLINDFTIKRVILETPVSYYELLYKRIKNHGFLTIIGQILFKLIIFNSMRRRSIQRINELMDMYSLNDALIPGEKINEVSSVNSEKTKELLEIIDPDIVIINGTRIISKDILNCVRGLFLNIHVGITPLYRGVYGAYWALVENNKQACGVTVHLVDPGIDTGGILEQGIIHPTKEDNCATYQYLQVAAGLDLLKKVISEAGCGSLAIKPNPPGPSRLWSHPTLWDYLYYRIAYGIK